LLEKHLYDGLSIRQTAKKESVSESATRHWTKWGK